MHWFNCDTIELYVEAFISLPLDTLATLELTLYFAAVLLNSLITAFISLAVILFPLVVDIL